LVGDLAVLEVLDLQLEDAVVLLVLADGLVQFPHQDEPAGVAAEQGHEVAVEAHVVADEDAHARDHLDAHGAVYGLPQAEGRARPADAAQAEVEDGEEAGPRLVDGELLALDGDVPLEEGLFEGLH
jgi:hypothetical protein